VDWIDLSGWLLEDSVLPAQVKGFHSGGISAVRYVTLLLSLEVCSVVDVVLYLLFAEPSAYAPLAGRPAQNSCGWKWRLS